MTADQAVNSKEFSENINGFTLEKPRYSILKSQGND